MQVLGTIVIFIIILAINWERVRPFFIGGFWLAVLGIVAAFIYNLNQKEKERLRKDQEASERAHQAKLEVERLRLNDLARKEEEARRKRTSLENEIKETRISNIRRIEAIPHYVTNASNQLHEAEQLFKERLYYPFWDKMEEATKTLSNAQKEMQAVKSESARYLQLSREFGDSVPAFPASSDLGKAFSGCRVISDRVQSIVRSAHKDHQFASIYATRMTNNILKSGFSNLIQALEGISAGIDQVGHQLSDGFSSMARSNLALRKAVIDLSSQINDANEAFAEVASSSARQNTDLQNQIVFQGRSISEMNSESARREVKVIEILDRIQRKETPPPRWLSS